MRALQITRTGSLDALTVRDVPDPVRAGDDVVIRIEAAGVNPSDVGIVMGRFPQLTLPRVMGRDFAGTVVDGPAGLIGKPVWGTGGGELGLTRDGAHAQLLAIPAHAVSVRPPHLSAEGAAAIGTPALTAWLALVELAATQAGEYVIVTGAAGSVGTAAVQIVNALGAHPIPVDRGDDIVAKTRELTNGEGANVALNAVGAAVYPALVDALRKGGRMVIFSAAGGKDVALDLFAFYRKRLTFYGLDSAALSLEKVGALLDRINPYLESRALQPPPVAERYPLESAPEAFARVSGGASGKIVLTF
ncbi:MAG TPA: zinc-binding alcohol dehydrogenase family protein [Candidatus Baltobacteraceae bacterium]